MMRSSRDSTCRDRQEITGYGDGGGDEQRKVLDHRCKKCVAGD